MARNGERDPRRERFWRVVLRKQRRSGLTVRAYCGQEQISEASYYAWRREIARRDLEPQAPAKQQRGLTSNGASFPRARRPPAVPPVFQELAILGDDGRRGAPACLEIVLPDGCQVRVPSEVDRTLLGDVIAMLEARRC
jgi:hypothetical protein